MGFLHTGKSDVEPIVQEKNVNLDPNLQNQQQAFANALQQQSQGQGPSAAGMMLEQQAQRNAASANAMAAGQRGVNSGLAMRQAMQAGSQANQQAGQQAALSRVQEQLGAQGMYGNQLGQMQGQNLTAQQANQNANLQAQGINAGVAVKNTENKAGFVGGLINAAGSAAAALSDERVKTGVQEGSKDAYAFLDALSAHKFRYKHPETEGAAPGEQLGVMAQDLERTPAGNQMVTDTPEGKMIDPARGIGAVLAAQADLHDRLKALEGGKPKKMAQGGVITDPTAYLPDFGVKSKGMQINAPKFAKKEGGGDVAGYTMPEIGSQYSTPGPSLGSPNLSQETIGAPVAAPGPSLGSYNYGKPAFSHGGKVSGKSKVKGDSESNDTVHAMLSPGEIVVPRSQATDAEKAKEFIDHVMKTKRGKNASGSTYTRVLAAHRELGDALKAHQKKGA